MTTATMEEFRVEVMIPGEGWKGNAMTYPMLIEAWDAGADLLSRWFVPTDFRVMLGDDPYAWAVYSCRGCSPYVRGELAPSHRVSPRCEHGSDKHCTGDGCF